MNFLLITDALLEPFDEGFRKFTHQLECYCRKRGYPVLDLNRGFMGGLASQLFKRYDCLVYLPLSSITLNSFIRAAFFKWLTGARNGVIIGLQPRNYRPFQRKVIQRLSIGVAVQSLETTAELLKIGVHPVLSIQSGVNGSVFKLVDQPGIILQLRQKYGMPLDKKIILHVGHLKRDRNIARLMDIQRQLPGVQTLIVASTSTGVERETTTELQNAGVMVINHYLPHIEEIYQLADLYFFPVVSKFNSIEIPLSVIEALSCGLPVLSVKNLGGANLPGLFLIDSLDNTVGKVREILSQGVNKAQIAAGVSGYDWEAVFTRFFAGLENSNIEGNA